MNAKKYSHDNPKVSTKMTSSIYTWMMSNSFHSDFKKRGFDNLTSFEANVEEEFGQPISLLENQLSYFVSFKLSLISFFILTFRIHIISLNYIIFVQHCLEDRVPLHVHNLLHLPWDCLIHEEDVQQAHYLDHLSNFEAALPSQSFLSFATSQFF